MTPRKTRAERARELRVRLATMGVPEAPIETRVNPNVLKLAIRMRTEAIMRVLGGTSPTDISPEQMDAIHTRLMAGEKALVACAELLNWYEGLGGSNLPETGGFASAAAALRQVGLWN